VILSKKREILSWATLSTSAPISPPMDFAADGLRRLARKTRDTKQSRRLLSLAAVLHGMNRTEAARIGGMDRQTLRDWVHRFNSEGPDGLKDRPGGGMPSALWESPRVSRQSHWYQPGTLRHNGALERGEHENTTIGRQALRSNMMGVRFSGKPRRFNQIGCRYMIR
jgi:transposase